MPIPNSTSTPASEISLNGFRDDGGYSAEAESSALADILRKSPAASLLGIDSESQSEEEEKGSTPGESSEEQEAQEPDESSDDLDEDGKSKESEEESESKDDTSTDAELPTEEDIDWEYKVPVTIDGKTEYKTLADIRKGFATEQHLSQKGRELGEQRKLLEAERNEKLQEVITLSTVLNQELTSVETSYAEQYESLTNEINKARDGGDAYTARDLKEKREQVQEKYWEARNKREAQFKDVAAKWQQEQESRQAQMLEDYNKRITEFVPDYTEKVAKSVREFAIKEGIPEVMLDSVYSPEIVKFINEYRKLKTAKESGEVKRKAAPVAKSIPTKKGVLPSQKAKVEQGNLRSKVLSGAADNTDQMNFLKSISSISRKL